MPIISLRKSGRMSRKIRNENKNQPIEDPKIREFLDAQSENTRKTYESNFRRVLEFSKNESGSTMLENVSIWSRKILTFQQWLKSQGYSDTSTETTTGMLRGYFAFFDSPLSLSRAKRRTLGNKGEREHEDYAFSQSDLKKMSEIGDLKEKYVVLCGASYGLRSEDFVKITYGKYRIALESNEKENERRKKEGQEPLFAPIKLGEINTSKEHVLAYPFISSDAFPIVQAMLDSHKDAKDSDRVFTERKTQLTEILQNLFKKCGLDSHGQHVRFHSLRKYTFDRIVSVSSTTKANQIIGHKIKGEIAPYIGQGSLREVYERAQPSIVVSNGNGAVKAKVEALSTTTEQLIKMLAEKDQEIQQLKKDRDEKQKEIDGLKINQHDMNKTLANIMELPTVKRELFKRKEKVEM
jgi:hypothetical protein